MQLLDNVILILFLSFVVGVLVDPILRRMTNYEFLSGRFLFENSKTYERLGVLGFRRFLLATPFGSFNREIRLTHARDLETLKQVRNHMATAEMSHWVGFTVMLAMTIVAWCYRGTYVGAGYLLFNGLGNLYPCLLQQYNKRRITHLISLVESRMASQATS